MNVIVDITPKHKIVPSTSVFTFIKTRLEIHAQTENMKNTMNNLARKYGLRFMLDVNGIAESMPANNFNEFVARCLPLRSINVAIHKLAQWEAFVLGLCPYLCHKLSGASRQIKFRSFNIADDDESMLGATEMMIKLLSHKNHANVDWEWLANHGPNFKKNSNASRWIVGVDGTGDGNVANLRAWKNFIIINMKKVDLITSGRENYAVPAMIFTLLTLNTGGSAVIRIDDLSRTSTLTMLHLFINCFAHSSPICTLAGDHVFICANGYQSTINAKYQSLLMSFLNIATQDPDTSLYNPTFYSDDGFIQFIGAIEDFQYNVLSNRIDRYSSMLSTYSQISRSKATNMFANIATNIIDDAFVDKSHEWKCATEYEL